MEDGGPSLTAKEKRQEQLKRWENSATDLESKVLSNVKPRVKFDDGAVFLAACSSGDLKEVGVLLNNGADINFANIDGLTALHQACIDGNLDVVEYLIERGIDIDQEDNEGWTPLHAASSCGYMDIARYLVEHEANVVAVNSEGEVPLDIAEEDEMVEYLQQEVDKRDLDIDEARNREREMMAIDAKQHLNAVQNGENPTIYMHPKSGATALHVAAAKGYIDVIRILLQAGMAPNARDTDGWTPLHAASHWSQQEAAKLLADRNADFNIRSKLGQTPFDVADEEMLDYLEVLQEQQKENNAQMKETPVIGNPPSPVTYEKPSQPQQDSFDPLLSRSNNPNSHSFGGSIQAHPNGTEKSRETSSHFKLSHHADEVSSSSDDDEDSTSSSSEVASSKGGSKAFEKPKQIENDIDHRRPPLGLARVGSSDTVNLRNRDNQDSRSKLTQSASSGNVSSIASRRTTRPASLHLSSSAAHKDIRPPVMSAHEIGSRPTAAAQPIVASKTTNGPGPTPGTPTERNPDIKEGAPGTWRSGLRKTGSYDEKTKPFPRSAATPARPTDADKTENKRTARVAPIIDARAMSKPGGKESDSTSDKQGYQRSGSYRRHAADAAPSSSSSHASSTYRRSADDENTSSSVTSSATRDLSDSQSAAATTEENKQDRRRSHLQPVRDEEAEAQRRARSRRERQARRSTQGVTLDVVEEAKRQIESKMHESKLSSQADNSSSSEQARLPHNDSIAVNLHRRHKDLHSSTGSTGSSAASQARTVTLPSGYIPSAERVKMTASSGPFVAGNVPSITVNDDRVDKNDGESLDDGDDDKNATPGEQSPSAKKSAAHQRRRQRKERRSTGLPGLRVTDHVATDVSDRNEDAYSRSSRRLGSWDGDDRKAEVAVAVSNRLEQLRRERHLKVQNDKEEDDTGSFTVKPTGSPKINPRSRLRYSSSLRVGSEAAKRRESGKADDDDEERHRAFVARLTGKLKRHSGQDTDQSDNSEQPSQSETTLVRSTSDAKSPLAPSDDTLTAMPGVVAEGVDIIVVTSSEDSAITRRDSDHIVARSEAVSDTKQPSLVEMFAVHQPVVPKQSIAQTSGVELTDSAPQIADEAPATDATSAANLTVQDDLPDSHLALLRHRRPIAEQTPAVVEPAVTKPGSSSGDAVKGERAQVDDDDTPLLPSPDPVSSEAPPGEGTSSMPVAHRPSRFKRFARYVCCLGCFVAFCGVVRCWSD